MAQPTESVRQVHDFLDGIDWELVEEASEIGETGYRFLRDHPWLLIAAGSILTAGGILQALRNKRGRKTPLWAREDADPHELMSP